jgi:hypothetical protein
MVGWARSCAHADTKPRGQTINLSAHPTLFSENKFTLLARQRSGWERHLGGYQIARSHQTSTYTDKFQTTMNTPTRHSS